MMNFAFQKDEFKLKLAGRGPFLRAFLSMRVRHSDEAYTYDRRQEPTKMHDLCRKLIVLKYKSHHFCRKFILLNTKFIISVEISSF